MKKKMVMSLVAILCSTMLITVPTRAQELTNTDKSCVEDLFAGVEPVEIAQGIYLRENDEFQIIDVDVSKAERVPVEAEEIVNTGEVWDNNSNDFARVSYWDLDDSDYEASFQAKYRVFTKTYFKGYEEFYVDYTDVKCPSGSKWKAGLYIGTNEKLKSEWYSSGTKQLYMHYYNLSTSESYRAAFEKTDNDDQASGKMRVHL